MINETFLIVFIKSSRMLFSFFPDLLSSLKNPESVSYYSIGFFEKILKAQGGVLLYYQTSSIRYLFNTI